MFVEESMSYNMDEKEFIEYFNRCRDRCGNSFDEIENKLPQLQKMHDDMVKEEVPFYRRSLKELFNEWKRFNSSPWI